MTVTEGVEEWSPMLTEKGWKQKANQRNGFKKGIRRVGGGRGRETGARILAYFIMYFYILMGSSPQHSC